MTGKTAIRAACFAGFAAVAGCATTPPPAGQVAAARAAIDQAQPIAAKEAPLELATANRKLALAEEAMQRGDYLHARIHAEQAEADANLAAAAAQNARTQRAAAEVTASIETLREELKRRPQQ